jgi:predicted nucleic acid-binding protein
MAAEPPAPDEPLFLDTSVLIAATVEVHPSHAAAAAYADVEVDRGVQMCISSQVCREFLVVLTRQPVSGRVFTLDEALWSLDVWMTGCVVLEENLAVFLECLSLIRRYGVHGKQVHDCNVVATMRAHGVRRPATRNAADFRRFEGVIRVEEIAG